MKLPQASEFQYFYIRPDCPASHSCGCFGRTQAVNKAVTNKADPRTTNGKKYPPTEYNVPPTIGPTINPNPKNVSNEAFEKVRVKIIDCLRLNQCNDVTYKSSSNVVRKLFGNDCERSCQKRGISQCFDDSYRKCQSYKPGVSLNNENWEESNVNSAHKMYTKCHNQYFDFVEQSETDCCCGSGEYSAIK